MKKILIYLMFFILVCFIIPAMLTRRSALTVAQESDNLNVQQNEEANNNVEKVQNYEYSKYGTINLLHKKTGEIEQVKLDEYLCNVVSAEMPADYELEALKAQSIVARTYTIYKIVNKKHENADICDDSTCCQAWISKEDRLARWDENKKESNWQKICDVVESTK